MTLYRNFTSKEGQDSLVSRLTFPEIVRPTFDVWKEERKDVWWWKFITHGLCTPVRSCSLWLSTRWTPGVHTHTWRTFSEWRSGARSGRVGSTPRDRTPYESKGPRNGRCHNRRDTSRRGIDLGPSLLRYPRRSHSFVSFLLRRRTSRPFIGPAPWVSLIFIGSSEDLCVCGSMEQKGLPLLPLVRVSTALRPSSLSDRRFPGPYGFVAPFPWR